MNWKTFIALLAGTYLLSTCDTIKSSMSQSPVPGSVEGQSFENITLESSLKPFKKKDKADYKRVATEMFMQWHSLLRHADTVSIMLWTSDGSEILDYSGRLDQPLEWSKYIGNPNTEHAVGSGPVELSLHERAYLYMDDPPNYSYGDLKNIIEVLKETGKEITGKPVRVGATFDPGPEFARSDFKYNKHPEILEGSAMGHKSFVYSYATLKADPSPYAGFPRGIPEGTPFGTFFGRQSQHFLKDLGYDYIWFSNGFGFGMEPWASTGVIFTGTGFNYDRLADTREKIIRFWKLFRNECPDYRIETRGTNLSTGIDLAKDGVDLRSIYEGGFNILPPPNSPWAALDGDFGLEMIGYMSRMAELPDHRYIFRYYTHDPWWLNSPWLDRYGSEPHDIYLPMSVGRINAEGKISLPTHLNFLTIDNSFGNMPKQVPDEVIPHILKARYNSPTSPGPLVWVYPFDEYHNWVSNQPQRLDEMYFGDWYIRQAINNGLPLNTVLSTRSLPGALKNNPHVFDQSVLLGIVPDAGSEYEKAIMDFVNSGGKVVLYGPADNASGIFKEWLNLKNEKAIEGEFKISTNYSADHLEKSYPSVMRHQALFSGGGLSTMVGNGNDVHTKILATLAQGENHRDVVWTRSLPEWKGGMVAYVRGTNSSHFEGGRLLKPDDPDSSFVGPLYLRYVLEEFGLEYSLEKESPGIKNPVLTISRNNNGYFLSGYVPNTTVKHRFRFPQGAPILTGYDTKLEEGRSTYFFPLSWNRECRVFVEQEEGIVSLREMHSGELGINRRLKLSGLKNATVSILPSDTTTHQSIHFYLNASYPWREGKLDFESGDKKFGNNYMVRNVTGDLVVSW